MEGFWITAVVLLTIAAIYIWRGVFLCLYDVFSRIHQDASSIGVIPDVQHRVSHLEQGQSVFTGLIDTLSRRLDGLLSEVRSLVSDDISTTITPQLEAHSREIESLSERLKQIDATISGLKKDLKRTTELHTLENSLGETQQILQSMAKTLEEVSGSSVREEAMGMKVRGWEERLDSVEKAVGEIAGSSASVLSDELESLKQQLAATSEGSREILGRLEELSGSVEKMAGLEQDIAEIRTSLRDRADIQQTEVISQEPQTQGNRINSRPDVDTVGVVQDGQRERRGPRMISAEGRAKFQQVIDLAAEGHTIETIAMRTGLDTAEIELMIAGQSPQQQS